MAGAVHVENEHSPRLPRGFERGRAARRRRDTAAALALVSPSVLLIGVFGIFPLFFTAYVSLFNWRLAGGRFLALGNYAELLGPGVLPLVGVVLSVGAIVAGALLVRHGADPSARSRRWTGLAVLAAGAASFVLVLPRLAAQGDSEVFDSFRVTVWYALLTVPVQLVAGLALALALTRKVRGRQLFRVVYLLPYVAPTVATAAIFQLLFSLRPDSSANQVLALLGIHPLQWLQEPGGIVPLLFGGGAGAGAVAPAGGVAPGVVASYWAQWASGPSLALVSIIFYSWWVFVGYYALIYINGLMAIPRQLYEAAEVDGAGPARRFLSITLPLLSPTTYFLTLLGVIGTFKAFTQLYVLRSPAAAAGTDTISVEVFFTFFRKARLGYAAAISLVLFLIVLGLTLLQQRTLERGVTYGE
ncbi:MAG TPA: sugar ABC transporter permease [Spirochaetia bacterium]|nr:sugar ABC transporter permease [Spirochaetia bacterium]